MMLLPEMYYSQQWRASVLDYRKLVDTNSEQGEGDDNITSPPGVKADPKFQDVIHDVEAWWSLNVRWAIVSHKPMAENTSQHICAL